MLHIVAGHQPLPVIMGLDIDSFDPCLFSNFLSFLLLQAANQISPKSLGQTARKNFFIHLWQLIFFKMKLYMATINLFLSTHSPICLPVNLPNAYLSIRLYIHPLTYPPIHLLTLPLVTCPLPIYSTDHPNTIYPTIHVSTIHLDSDFRIKKGSWDWADRAVRWSDMLAMALCPLLIWVTSHWAQG